MKKKWMKMHHLLYGGATIADMSFSTKGLHGLGEQFSETVKLGELATTDENGNKLNAYEISQREDTLRTSLIGEIEKNLTPYDDQWIAAFRKLGTLTKRYVNDPLRREAGPREQLYPAACGPEHPHGTEHRHPERQKRGQRGIFEEPTGQLEALGAGGIGETGFGKH